MIKNLYELYQYRALLGSLVQRELKARYRASVLGFLWTFLNPTIQMAVYSVIFSVFNRNQGIEHFTYYIFVGLLPWTWFSSSLMAGASAISDRRDLLTKIHFPPQVLPATVVVTNLANYILSLPLMVGLGLLFGVRPSWHFVFFPLLALVQLLLTLGLAYIFSALNVRFRDLQQIVGNLVTLWFFATPILYRASFDEPSPNVAGRLRHMALVGNPMFHLTNAYHDIFYDHRVPNFSQILSIAGISVLILWVASLIFEVRREEFAEVA